MSLNNKLKKLKERDISLYHVVVHGSLLAFIPVSNVRSFPWEQNDRSLKLKKKWKCRGISEGMKRK
jgi:hypothetical protein